MGVIKLPLKTPPGVADIFVDFDIVQADVPALLGMDVLDREGLVADTVFNRLARRSSVEVGSGTAAYIEEWFIPLIRSPIAHVYTSIEKATRSHFTRAQLHKLHRQFFHPSSRKLYNLILKARPEQVTSDTLKILEEISRR